MLNGDFCRIKSMVFVAILHVMLKLSFISSPYIIYGTKYSRMDQVKCVEDSL